MDCQIQRTGRHTNTTHIFPGVITTDVEDVQLHICFDVSKTAYACVTYFRATIHGWFYCALVGRKA